MASEVSSVIAAWRARAADSDIPEKCRQTYALCVTELEASQPDPTRDALAAFALRVLGDRDKLDDRFLRMPHYIREHARDLGLMQGNGYTPAVAALLMEAPNA